MNLQLFFQNLANGISLGSLYALIAIGYTMVYGILRFINFAHGEVIMLATYFAYFGIMLFSLPWWLSFVFATVLTGVLGMVIEKAAYKPLRESPRITVLISAIGVSFLIQNLCLVIFGGRPKAFHQPALFTKAITIGNIKIPSIMFITPVIAGVLLYLVNYLVNNTKTGMAMRAAAKDFDTAKLMGIDINRIISITFTLGSALAAVGVLCGLDILKYIHL